MKKQFNRLNLEQILDKISEENISRLKYDEARNILIQANQLGNLYRANLRRAERKGTIYKAKILGEQKKEQSFSDYEFKLPDTKGMNKGQARNAMLSRLRKVRHFLRAKTKTVGGNIDYLKSVAKILNIKPDEISLSQQKYDEFWKQVSRVQKTDSYRTILMQKTYSSEQLVKDAYKSMTDPVSLLKENLKYLSKEEIEEMAVLDKEGRVIDTNLDDPQVFIDFITTIARKLNETAVRERESLIKAKEEDLLYGFSTGRKD